VGESQFGRLEKKPGTLSTLCVKVMHEYCMPDLEGSEVVFSPVRSEFSLESIPGPIPLVILLDTQILVHTDHRTFKIDEHSFV
jgi:hypothetical protein